MRDSASTRVPTKTHPRPTFSLHVTRHPRAKSVSPPSSSSRPTPGSARVRGGRGGHHTARPADDQRPAPRHGRQASLDKSRRDAGKGDNHRHPRRHTDHQTESLRCRRSTRSSAAWVSQEQARDSRRQQVTVAPRWSWTPQGDTHGFVDRPPTRRPKNHKVVVIESRTTQPRASRSHRRRGTIRIPRHENNQRRAARAWSAYACSRDGDDNGNYRNPMGGAARRADAKEHEAPAPTTLSYRGTARNTEPTRASTATAAEPSGGHLLPPMSRPWSPPMTIKNTTPVRLQEPAGSCSLECRAGARQRPAPSHRCRSRLSCYPSPRTPFASNGPACPERLSFERQRDQGSPCRSRSEDPESRLPASSSTRCASDNSRESSACGASTWRSRRPSAAA